MSDNKETNEEAKRQALFGDPTIFPASSLTSPVNKKTQNGDGEVISIDSDDSSGDGGGGDGGD